MAEQVGPTRPEPGLDNGLRDRSLVEVGVCGFHQGPGAQASQHEAGYMSATDPFRKTSPSLTLACAGWTIYVQREVSPNNGRVSSEKRACWIGI